MILSLIQVEETKTKTKYIDLVREKLYFFYLELNKVVFTCNNHTQNIVANT